MFVFMICVLLCFVEPEVGGLHIQVELSKRQKNKNFSAEMFSRFFMKKRVKETLALVRAGMAWHGR
jgi:hypothetical protein